MIRFELKDIDKVMLFGGEPTYTAHWFALTDGIYWLNFGQTNIYEYSDEFLKTYDDSVKFVDYYIVRLLEDITELFPEIGEPIPIKFHKLVDTPEKLSDFLTSVGQWYLKYEDEENSDDFFDKACEMRDWISRRTLSALHLQNYPYVSFFRVGDNIQIIWWKNNSTTEEGIPVWQAKNGSMTFTYTEFIEKIEKFGMNFFSAMDLQIQKAIDKDWGENVEIDKPRLLVEQQERKAEFEQQLEHLKHSPNKTDWNKIENQLAELYA